VDHVYFVARDRNVFPLAFLIRDSRGFTGRYTACVSTNPRFTRFADKLYLLVRAAINHATMMRCKAPDYCGPPISYLPLQRISRPRFCKYRSDEDSRESLRHRHQTTTATRASLIDQIAIAAKSLRSLSLSLSIFFFFSIIPIRIPMREITFLRMRCMHYKNGVHGDACGRPKKNWSINLRHRASGIIHARRYLLTHPAPTRLHKKFMAPRCNSHSMKSRSAKISREGFVIGNPSRGELTFGCSVVRECPPRRRVSDAW